MCAWCNDFIHLLHVFFEFRPSNECSRQAFQIGFPVRRPRCPRLSGRQRADGSECGGRDGGAAAEHANGGWPGVYCCQTKLPFFSSLFYQPALWFFTCGWGVWACFDWLRCSGFAVLFANLLFLPSFLLFVRSYGNKHRDFYPYLSAKNPSKTSRSARETMAVTAAPVEYTAPSDGSNYEVAVLGITIQSFKPCLFSLSCLLSILASPIRCSVCFVACVGVILEILACFVIYLSCYCFSK